MLSSFCVWGCTARGMIDSKQGEICTRNCQTQNASLFLFFKWIRSIERTVADPSDSRTTVQFQANGAIASTSAKYFNTETQKM